jgi:hypothetical protein
MSFSKSAACLLSGLKYSPMFLLHVEKQKKDKSLASGFAASFYFVPAFSDRVISFFYSHDRTKRETLERRLRDQDLVVGKGQELIRHDHAHQPSVWRNIGLMLGEDCQVRMACRQQIEPAAEQLTVALEVI